MIYCGLLEARVRDAVCRISPNLNRGHEIPITLILKKFQQTERFFENETLLGRVLYRTQSYKEIKKPEVEEDDGLSGDEISDKFVSVEDREETNTVVETD